MSNTLTSKAYKQFVVVIDPNEPLSYTDSFLRPPVSNSWSFDASYDPPFTDLKIRNPMEEFGLKRNLAPFEAGVLSSSIVAETCGSQGPLSNWSNASRQVACSEQSSGATDPADYKSELIRTVSNGSTEGDLLQQQLKRDIHEFCDGLFKHSTARYPQDATSRKWCLQVLRAVVGKADLTDDFVGNIELNKRHDQFVKKFLTVWCDSIYFAYKTRYNTKLDVMGKLKAMFHQEGLDNAQLENLLGSGRKVGFRNDTIDYLLCNKKMFASTITFEYMSDLVARLNDHTEQDIVTNILAKIKTAFCESPTDPFARFAAIFDGGRQCKKPYTYRENVLAALYFLNQLQKRAHGKHFLPQKADLDALSKQVEAKIDEPGENSFKRPNFIRVLRRDLPDKPLL